jgi:oligopeptide transport system substrate-binding protein
MNTAASRMDQNFGSLLSSVRRIAAEVAAPSAGDVDAKARFPDETVAALRESGVFSASVPRAEWKTKLGINIELEAMEFKVLLKKRHDGAFQIARNGFVADYNDASNFLALVRCDSDQNNNFNCNRKAEEIINQAEQSEDPGKRKVLLTQATQLIMEDYPIVPLVQYSLPRLVKSYVGGYSLQNAQDRFRSKDLYIIKH